MTEHAIDRAEFLPATRLAALQRSRWQAQRERVLAGSAFLRRLWDGASPPTELAALPSLPPCDKAMLREDQRAHPPFGSYLACAPEAVNRVHRTSGTTGQAMNLALTAADAALTAAVAGRAQAAAGLGPGHRVVHCLNYQLWMGGLTDHLGLEASGATVIPFGVGDTRRLVQVMRELSVTAISCTPSYPAVLEQVIEEHFAPLAPRDLGLRLGLFGGEPGLDDAGFRARLEQTWGFAARNSNYGVTDVLCNFAGQCRHDTDLHLVGADVLWPELVSPEDGAPLAWRAGETGELVLTHLAKEAQPLVRFRTGDIVTLTAAGEACACGRTVPRFRVVGRADDMVVVRGINVFPTQVAAVVNGFDALTGEYRIVVDGGAPLQRLPLEVELATAGGADAPALAGRVTEALKRELGIGAEVTVLPPRTLPRTGGKTRRVLRRG